MEKTRIAELVDLVNNIADGEELEERLYMVRTYHDMACGKPTGLPCTCNPNVSRPAPVVTASLSGCYAVK